MCFPCWEIIITEERLNVGITGIPPHGPPASSQVPGCPHGLRGNHTMDLLRQLPKPLHAHLKWPRFQLSDAPPLLPIKGTSHVSGAFCCACSHHSPSLHSCEPIHICGHSFLPPIITPLFSLREGPLPDQKAFFFFFQLY